MCVGEENPPKMAKFLQRAGHQRGIFAPSQQECSRKASWGGGELGKGGLGRRERSPQLLCLLTIPSPEQGFSTSSFRDVSQIFLARLMG